MKSSLPSLSLSSFFLHFLRASIPLLFLYSSSPIAQMTHTRVLSLIQRREEMCQSYYMCKRDPGVVNWELEKRDCPANQLFSDTSKQCVVAPRRQYTAILYFLFSLSLFHPVYSVIKYPAHHNRRSSYCCCYNL